MELKEDLREVFERHGFIWFDMTMESEADGHICKCYVLKEREN